MKTIDIIEIKTDGSVQLVPVTLRKGMVGLQIPNVNALQGPEFIRIQGNLSFTFVLEYNTNTREQIANLHSSYFLDIECCCGHKEHGCKHYGSFFLVKHNPLQGQNHTFDFSKDISYKEFELHDSHVSCTEEDIVWIHQQLPKKSNCWKRIMDVWF